MNKPTSKKKSHSPYSRKLEYDLFMLMCCEAPILELGAGKSN